MTRPRIITPIVVLTTLVTMMTGAANMWLEPERFGVWLLGVLFLPLTITGLYVLSRRTGTFSIKAKAAGGFRAGLVGAGVVLAVAFAAVITDRLGWTGDDGLFSTGPWMLIFLPAVAIAVDIFGDRLARMAEQEDERNPQ